jgi:hypothetical protein
MSYTAGPTHSDSDSHSPSPLEEVDAYNSDFHSEGDDPSSHDLLQPGPQERAFREALEKFAAEDTALSAPSTPVMPLQQTGPRAPTPPFPPLLAKFLRLGLLERSPPPEDSYPDEKTFKSPESRSPRHPRASVPARPPAVAARGGFIPFATFVPTLPTKRESGEAGAGSAGAGGSSRGLLREASRETPREEKEPSF